MSLAIVPWPALYLLLLFRRSTADAYGEPPDVQVAMASLAETVGPPLPLDPVVQIALFMPCTNVPWPDGVMLDTNEVPKGPTEFAFDVPVPPMPPEFFLPNDVNPDISSPLVIIKNMSINWPTNGEHFVPSYQISALPYLSSSIISNGQIHKYDFPYITIFIDVANKGFVSTDKIALAFTENGFKTGNYITLEQGDTVHHNIRCDELYVSCSAGTLVDYQVFCGLTTIPVRNFLKITGSNGHPGVG